MITAMITAGITAGITARIAGGITLISILGSAALAQSTLVPSPAQVDPFVIEHATIHTSVVGAPTIHDGFVVVSGGTITLIGSGNAPPSDARRIDATGLHLTPGFISSATTLGLIETGQVRATDDRTEHGQFHPEVSAWLAINPDSSLFPVARMGGVLLALVFPQGGVVSGEASLIRLNGWTNDDVAVVPDAGIIVRWPATEPAPRWYTTKNADEQEKARQLTMRTLNDFFDAAMAYSRARASDPSHSNDLRFDRLRLVLDGKRPLFIEAASAGQIESAVLWSIQRGMRPIIVGGQGAMDVADLLVTHKVPVILTGVLQLPRFAHDDYDSVYTLPGRLASRGIVVAIATGDEPSNDRNLVHHAAVAVAFGMTRDDALAAITRVPAQLSGAGEKYGVIAVGSSATMLLHAGDPLEVTTSVQQAWIDGRSLTLESHQTDLKAKYEQKYQLQKLGQTARPTPSTIPAK
ncbi:MAG: hypothetical protein EXS15_02890 [Phycisphaerales bacterium]|nr:hypothetical protein [Phycisphaerales bacterium]